AAAAAASSRARLGGQILVEGEEQLVQGGVAQQGVAHWAPPSSWSTKEATPSWAGRQAVRLPEGVSCFPSARVPTRSAEPLDVRAHSEAAVSTPNPPHDQIRKELVELSTMGATFVDLLRLPGDKAKSTRLRVVPSYLPRIVIWGPGPIEKRATGCCPPSGLSVHFLGVYRYGALRRAEGKRSACLLGGPRPG